MCSIMPIEYVKKIMEFFQAFNQTFGVPNLFLSFWTTLDTQDFPKLVHTNTNIKPHQPSII